MSRRRHKLKGRKFGPLEIICLFGSFSLSNIAWVYWCRACGHLGHRLGTHLTRGVNTRCPTCRATKRPHRLSECAARPSEKDVRTYLEKAPAPQHGPRLKGWTTEDLVALQARVHVELRRRREVLEAQIAKDKAKKKARARTVSS